MEPASTPPKGVPRIAVLNAGSCVLALALRLLRRFGRRADVIVLEREADVGGLAGGFEQDGIPFDFGSHRTGYTQ